MKTKRKAKTKTRTKRKSKTTKLSINLTPVELGLLLQSLDHCLATCKNKTADGGPCADCDAARALLNRLAKLAPRK